MASINTMLTQCSALVDTKDVSEWENGFLKSILDLTEHGKKPSRLSEKQLDVLERLHRKHFAG